MQIVNKKGLATNAIIGSLVTILILGALAVTFFTAFNTTALTSAGAPTFVAVIIPLLLAVVIVTFLLKAGKITN